MPFSLQKLIPGFIETEKIAGSQVWDQDLQYNNQENIHIIAPSGRGKTSLVHFLYGLRNDYTGVITYDGKNINGMDGEALASFRGHSISIVFQDLRLFPNHTVMQNISVKRQLQPYHKENKIEYMAERLGIKNKLNRICGVCSYGEQQRIAIIRALQQPFDFILLDEPFSHLDEQNRKKAMDLIQEEANERKASVILADLQEIVFFKADKLYSL